MQQDKIEKYYDEDGSASHYNDERINMMILSEQIFGTQILMNHYEISLLEYRNRLGKKDSDSPEQELLKIKWFETAVKFLFNKLGTPEEVKGLNPRNKYPLPSQFKSMLKNVKK